jgi:hypothetical protein
MDGTWLLLSSLFSLIGMAVCVYGRRQRLVVPTILGIVLMIYPYFVGSTLALVAIGVLLLGGVIVGLRVEG